MQNGLASPEVDIGRGEIAETLVVAPMIVLVDECIGQVFDIAGQEVVLEQDTVLLRLVPSLDLASLIETCKLNGIEPYGWSGGRQVLINY